MGQPEAGQHRVDLVAMVVATAPLEALGEGAILGEGGLKLGAFGLRQALLELAKLLLQTLQSADRLPDQLVDGERGGARGLLLGQVADLDAVPDGDPAAVWR